MTIDPVSLGITLALTAAQMALQASTKIEGPRLDDLSVSVADYGAAIFNFHGIRKTDGPSIFFAEPLHEVHREAKTKGGKYNEYTYFGTWAVLLAGHEIEAVTRIWFDRHLVYQATDAGPPTIFPIAYTNIANKGKGTSTTTANLADHMRIYLGTETQTADPRMLATIEAAHGVGSCPAYRGSAYVMFEEVPLEKFGNRIPQVTVEMVRGALPSYPYETFDIDVNNSRLWNTVISPDGTKLIWAAGDSFEIWDLPSRTRLNYGMLPTGTDTDLWSCESIGILSDGSILLIGDTATKMYRYSPDCSSLISTFEFDPTITNNKNQGAVYVAVAGNGQDYWGTSPYSINTEFFFNAAEMEMVDLTGIIWNPTCFFTDGYGDVWAAGCHHTGGVGITTAYFLRMVSASGRSANGFLTVTGLVPSGSGLMQVQAVHVMDATHDQFVFNWGYDALYAVSVDTGAVLASNTTTGLDVYNCAKQFANLRYGATSVWLNATEVSLLDLTVIRTVDLLLWKAEDSDGILYIPALDALACWPQFNTDLTIRYLDRIGADTVTLRQIAEDVAGQCGLADYDFTDLTQAITGYSWVLGAGSEILEPLFDAYDSDLRPHDFTVQGLKRAGTASLTITTEWLARQSGEARYKIDLCQASELPRALIFNFADVAADQQSNSVRVSRPVDATDARGEQTIDMTTLVLSVNDARQLANRYFRRLWNSRETITNSLTMQQAALEPADLRYLTLDGETVAARATRATFAADGRINLEWVPDSATLALLDGSIGAPMDGRVVPAVILVTAPSKAAILDIPLIHDVDDSRVPFLYYAAGPYSSAAWTGADVWTSDTGLLADYIGGWGAVPSSDPMVWGITTNALPDALPWLFDRASTLNVNFKSGTPTGATETELLANGTLNLILVGDEMLQYSAATLEADGSWTLSTLLRGVRGTEWATDGHAVGETVVLLSSRIHKRSMGTSEIGDTDTYRAVSQGRTVDSAFEESVTFGAAAQKPYAAAHGELTLDSGSGDWSIDATRRTRIGGANVDGADVPLGETSESWSCDILDGAAVVRTITGTSLPLTYTSAQQTTDFGAPQSSLSVNLYQVAPDLALRGYPLAIAA